MDIKDMCCTRHLLSLVKDRFLKGVSSEYVQVALLRSPPGTLNKARDTARRAKAAQAAQCRLRSRRMAGVSSISMTDTANGILTLSLHQEIAAVSANCGCEDQLAEAICCNTEVLKKLMSQLSCNTSTVPVLVRPVDIDHLLVAHFLPAGLADSRDTFDITVRRETRWPVPWGEHQPRSM